MPIAVLVYCAVLREYWCNATSWLKHSLSDEREDLYFPWNRVCFLETNLFDWQSRCGNMAIWERDGNPRLSPKNVLKKQVLFPWFTTLDILSSCDIAQAVSMAAFPLRRVSNQTKEKPASFWTRKPDECRQFPSKIALRKQNYFPVTRQFYWTAKALCSETIAIYSFPASHTENPCCLCSGFPPTSSPVAYCFGYINRGILE